MQTFYLRREDYPPDLGWRLLDWCLARGADEFGLAFLGPPYLPNTAWAVVDELLATFRRRVASAGDRWRLTAETVAVLHSVLAGGLFAFTPGESSLQDLTVYRGGDVLLRIVTGEGEGMLQLRDDEESALERARLPYHRRPR